MGEIIAFVIYFVIMLTIGVWFFVKTKDNGDKEYFGISFGGIGGETAFAAAKLKPQLLVRREGFLPFAGHGFGLGYKCRACLLHSGKKIGLFSHSHRITLLIFVLPFRITYFYVNINENKINPPPVGEGFLLIFRKRGDAPYQRLHG